MAATAPQLKLIYLDHHYWRAECARLALFMAGVPFEDARMGYEGMYASGALTFGTFPALVVPGKGVLNQTQAIARYVGHLTGMYPSDPFLAAKCDEAIDGLTDVSDLVTDTMQELCGQGFKRRFATAFERDPKRKMAWRAALVAPDGRMTMLLNGLETLLKQNGARPVPYVAGSSLSVADLAIWRAVGWISSGVIDGIAPTYMQTTFPLLWALHCAVDQDPKVAEWKMRNPHHYKR
ncbi:GST1 [Symbiodinium sp. CCMP2456]|nr:GST1 [Symbiodinium sp. CCMP2456]